MKCPIDTTVDLLMTDRNGIEIDYCPTCRGVWLDRGELDKIIERAALPAAAPPAAPVIAAADDPRWKSEERRRHAPQPDQYPYEYDDSDRRPYPRKKKKRESFLGDLFDF